MLPNRVLTTGAAGFIGRALATRLLTAGAEVHGTSRTSRSRDDFPITWHQGSLQDFYTAQQIVKKVKPDIIYHLAGMVTGANGIDNVILTYHSLVTSTVNLLAAAAQVDCQRIIIVGSSNEPEG